MNDFDPNTLEGKRQLEEAMVQFILSHASNRPPTGKETMKKLTLGQRAALRHMMKESNDAGQSDFAVEDTPLKDEMDELFYGIADAIDQEAEQLRQALEDAMYENIDNGVEDTAIALTMKFRTAYTRGDLLHGKPEKTNDE